MEESRLRDTGVSRIDNRIAAWLAWSLCALSLVRWRIQSLIDRRSYRQKYDAARMPEAFSARLRDGTDLGTLSRELTGAVQKTMQPEPVSLWLRPGTMSGTLRVRR